MAGGLGNQRVKIKNKNDKSKCKNLSPANWVGFVKTFGLTGFEGGDRI